MSTKEKGVEESTKAPPSSKSQHEPQQQQQLQPVTDTHSITPQSSGKDHASPDTSDPKSQHPEESRLPDQSTSDTTYPSTPENAQTRPKQVIAVNASKGPAAFFNLARKFLVVDEVCDLSALEGAIVSAADAAHLLERSKLATIVRIQTSYATVEPKRRRQELPQQTSPYTTRQQPHHQHQSRELRRARIVITVKRTEQYKRWLDENPYQAVLAGDGTVEEVSTEAEQPSPSVV